MLVDADEAQARKLGVAGQNWERLFISQHHIVDQTGRTSGSSKEGESAQAETTEDESEC